jgi:hypothetical protein
MRITPQAGSVFSSSPAASAAAPMMKVDLAATPLTALSGKAVRVSPEVEAATRARINDVAVKRMDAELKRLDGAQRLFPAYHDRIEQLRADQLTSPSAENADAIADMYQRIAAADKLTASAKARVGVLREVIDGKRPITGAEVRGAGDISPSLACGDTSPRGEVGLARSEAGAA